MEMRPGLEKTGGYVVMSESFTGNIFKQSFRAVFARDSSGQYLRMAFGATLEVRPRLSLTPSSAFTSSSMAHCARCACMREPNSSMDIFP